MNDKEIVRRAMSILGSKTSPAKRRAARANARKPRRRRSNATDAVQAKVA